ncbi:MAG: hypothetical protein AB1792_05920 [Candidatus Zixiibacteriota bacterium]
MRARCHAHTVTGTRIITLAVLVVAAAAWDAFVPRTARADGTIEIADLSSRDLVHRYFTVDRDLDVTIAAVGAALESGQSFFAYPWILDAKTRTMVWSLDEEITEPVPDSKSLRRFEGNVRLRRGSYELYYYVGWPDIFPGGFDGENLGEVFKRLGEALSRLGRGDKNDGLSSLAPRYHVVITGDAAALRETVAGTQRAPAVGLVRPGNDSYRQEGFTLQADLDLEIYAIGEYSQSGDAMVDWGWINDARLGRRVWVMTRENTDLAGGAAKNRRFHDRVHLPRGDYVAFYVTDDSHTYDDWNAPPPYDPGAWGLQIIPIHEAERPLIIPYEGGTSRAALLRMVEIGDNELKSQAFRLTRAEPLRVYAIGEYDQYDNRMADYAWVVKAENKRKVWEMTWDNTEPAGGARKNRQFDGIVHFDAGDFLLYYSSDGSHSYAGGWNTSPPHDQQSYGVTLFPATDGFDTSTFVVVPKSRLRTPGVIAALTEVGDDEEREQRFTLSSPTRVHIHAVGEGTRSGMSDYGWIEEIGTGDVVWEMTYRKTSHAGGTEKNRVVDQTILLDKGEYLLRFVTDDSHAFGDWNAAPPEDQAGWGVTLTLADQAPN